MVALVGVVSWSDNAGREAQGNPPRDLGREKPAQGVCLPVARNEASLSMNRPRSLRGPEGCSHFAAWCLHNTDLGRLPDEFGVTDKTWCYRNIPA